MQVVGSHDKYTYIFIYIYVCVCVKWLDQRHRYQGSDLEPSGWCLLYLVFTNPFDGELRSQETPSKNRDG